MGLGLCFPMEILRLGEMENWPIFNWWLSILLCVDVQMTEEKTWLIMNRLNYVPLPNSYAEALTSECHSLWR
jgi:hypothetical protein